MRGFSTLEILLAVAILSSAIVGVALVAFGNQSLLTQGGSADEALALGQSLIESESVLARQDFRLLHSIAATTSDGFHESVKVEDWPGDPYSTKRVTALVGWRDERGSARASTLTTLVTNLAQPDGLDTCNPAQTGNWNSPQLSGYILGSGNLLPTFVPAGHTFSSNNPIAGVDAYHGNLYVITSKKDTAKNDSLFVFDIGNPTHPDYLGSTSTNPAVTGGAAAVLVASSTAFIANTHVSNFKTCKPGPNCSQLQIVSVARPTVITTIANYLVPTSTTPFVTGTSTNQALGNALFYRNGFIYLGLTKTATGPEFNIIDVRDPANPKWLGGYQVGWTIDQIYVRGYYAYLATTDKSRELIILDISNPSTPTFVGSFDPTGTAGYEVGESEYLVGNNLYLGMSSATGSPELYALDVSHPTVPTALGSKVVGSSIFGMTVRDSVLYALTSTAKQVLSFDVSNPSSISASNAVALPGIGIASDCEGNYVYGASNNGTQGIISVIGPGV